MQRLTMQRLMLAPSPFRSSLPFIGRATFNRQFTASYSERPVSVTQKDFWVNLIPKPLRKSERSAASKKNIRSKEWNPATFYIWMFLLIGSMSIQMIALKNEHATFSRRADAKMGLLKEIVERIQKGEDVDVEGLLGKGNAQQEQEWEEVLKDIELESRIVPEATRRKEAKNEVREQEGKTHAHALAVSADEDHVAKAVQQKVTKPKESSNAPRGYY